MTPCPHCEALQDEVAYLRERLADRLNADILRILMKTFELTPGESRVVAALYQARGLVMKIWEIEEAARPDVNRDYDGNTMQVHIMRIRRKVGVDFVVNYRGQGYALSDAARLMIARAITADNEAKTSEVYVEPAQGTMWDAVKVGKLAEFRRQGLTYSECARRLHVSRNAAVGAGNRYLSERCA